MAPRLLACAVLSAVVGCGGVAAGPPDAAADAMVADAIVDDAILGDSTTPPLITDADSDDANAFVDASSLPPFDASLPSLPSCNAGSYFVTIVDGAGVQALDEGCAADAGAWAVPALVAYSCGNLCGYSQVEACGGGLSLRLQQTYPPPNGSSPVSFSVYVSFVDGNGNLLLGDGTLEFGAPPYVAGAHGTTLAGTFYTQLLATPHGQPMGAIEGTFCVLDGF